MKLNNGHSMPKIGLGTWQIDGKDIERCVRAAIEAGYRHIDTAYAYGTEKDLGIVLHKLFDEGVIKREDIFITSKLWNSFHNNPELGLKKTLNDLQLEYVDLYLVHWPVTFKSNEEGISEKDKEGHDVIGTYDALFVWSKMEELVSKGMTRSIGVANHGIKNLEKLLKHAKIKPAINQFEINPYFSQKDLIDFCQSHDISVCSYASLGSTQPNDVNLLQDPVLRNISNKYKKSVPQIILSWLFAKDILIIPKSTNEKHIESNIDLVDLNAIDLAKICELNRNYRFVDIPAWGEHRFD